MQKLNRFALIVTAVALFCSAAYADTFTTQAAFTTATSNPTTLNLAPYAGYQYTTMFPLTIAGSNPVTADPLGGFEMVNSATYAGNCCNLGTDTLYGGVGVTLTFSTEIYALSWTGANGASTPSGIHAFTPYDGDIQVTVGGVTYTVSGGSGTTPAFGGITSTTPFTTITFTPLNNPYRDASQQQAQLYELANITYAELAAPSTPGTTVPEPSSVLVLSTGLVGAIRALRTKLSR